MPKRPTIKIGDLFTNNEGCTVAVKEYLNINNVTVEFQDENKAVKSFHASSLRAGDFKNPYYPSVRGFGYLGVGEHLASVNRKNTLAYELWSNAIKRSYCLDYQKTRPRYAGCSVDERWANFQNFASWLLLQIGYNKGFHLDKDLLVKGNKVYSPETCCLIPQEVNCFLTGNNTKRGDLPVGVTRKNKKFAAQLSGSDKKWLGVFSCPEQAFQVYKTAKEDRAKQLANKYKDQIEPRAYEALMRYEVNIND